MFAVITPALILGSFAERVKFSGFLLFTALWSILVYIPMAHWVWGGGFLQQMGAIDFAGGTVVHINAGISALIMALMVGKRSDYKAGHPMTPHNVTFVFMGTAFLWLGWFGFNAGSGLCADGLAANAFLVTHLATCVAALTWMAIDWIQNKKPTTVGACTGAVAGLVAITPAAGTVDILGAICIGLLSSLVCFYMVAVVKPKLGYDDTLDAFGVHGIGGIDGRVCHPVHFGRGWRGRRALWRLAPAWGAGPGNRHLHRLQRGDDLRPVQGDGQVGRHPRGQARGGGRPGHLRARRIGLQQVMARVSDTVGKGSQ